MKIRISSAIIEQLIRINFVHKLTVIKSFDKLTKKWLVHGRHQYIETYWYNVTNIIDNIQR